MKLKGKVALVTGAGSGVGQGIAYALAAEGAAIACAGRTMKKVEASVAELTKRGAKAIAIQCDVKNTEHLANAVTRAVAELGGINILVNDAQEVPLGSLLNVPEKNFTAAFESGPMATFRLMKLCYPHLKKDGGSIINLASAAAKRWDMTNYGCYGAVKEAIRVLTRTAASEWGKDNIRTNVILPLANSPGMQWWSANAPEAPAFIKSIPMQYIGDCEKDIGRFVATLCSDECRYVNGQSIGLDGGQALIA
ncbi:MAG TPA: SDR family oxidoreductase [Verrucomicrobiae bacterium]|nr:SDR family oxidoreductase [Verrucomicrobiae bacterium]